MTEATGDLVIHQAIGGDPGAIAWIVDNAGTSDETSIVVVAALLERQPRHLERAWTLAVQSRDRQMVAIARARLTGDVDLVDALARDHLVDYPDSYVVAWIASDATGRDGRAAST
jgi:hypothetical protein